MTLQCLLVFIRPNDIQTSCEREVTTLMKRPVDPTLLERVSNLATNCLEVASNKGHKHFQGPVGIHFLHFSFFKMGKKCFKTKECPVD